MENTLVNNWVYQSNKIIEASYTLTVQEQKILRILASMVKKEDEDFTTYRFSISEISTILDINNKNLYKDIFLLSESLMKRVLKIKDPEKEQFVIYHWVETAKYSNGILELKIHPDLKNFYLNLNQYTKYKLSNILKFKSTYSFRLYELCKQYLKIGERELTIDSLRVILDLKDGTYPLFANMKQKILDKAVKEINTHTDINVSYDEIKEGRSIKSIRFYIYIAPNSYNENEIKGNNIQKVKNIFTSHTISDNMALKILEFSENNLEHIEKVYNHFKGKKCDNFMGLMMAMVKPGAFTETMQNASDTFSNFGNHVEYDYEYIERKLLGWEEDK